jgi:predicted SnoaL-like aldol condensation-catalyzing enzyme
MTANPSSMTANPSSVAATARVAVEADGVTVHRVVAGDDVAVVHGQSPTSSTAPTGLARVDVVRVGSDGSVVERTTVRQPVAGPNSSGHTMFDGGGDPAAAVGEAERRANEELVRRLYDEVFNGRNQGVVDELVAADYVQHSPAIGDGRDGLKALTANGLPVTVARLVAQGDLVAAQVVYPGGVAAVDIFRVADGRIVEHWDVLDLAS